MLEHEVREVEESIRRLQISKSQVDLLRRECELKDSVTVAALNYLERQSFYTRGLRQSFLPWMIIACNFHPKLRDLSRCFRRYLNIAKAF